jgi:hypothetical protein
MLHYNQSIIVVIYVCYLFIFQSRWSNGYHAHLECGRSWVRAPIRSNQRLWNWYCCCSAKHTAIRRKSKDWLDRNQENVSWVGWYVYLRIVFSVSYKNPTKRVGLVQSRSSFHWKLTCFRHDIAEKLVSWH